MAGFVANHDTAYTSKYTSDPSKHADRTTHEHTPSDAEAAGVCDRPLLPADPRQEAATLSKGTLGERWYTVRGLRVFARISEGTPAHPELPLVLVPGLNVGSAHMTPFARWLAPLFPIYAVDIPGYGRSGKPDHFLSIAEMAEWLVAWAEVAGISSAAWISSSFGVEILSYLAMRHPGLARCLVCASPTLRPSTRGFLRLPRLLGLWYKNHQREPSGVGGSTARDWFKTGLPRAVYTFGEMLNDNINERLPKISTPTLVVYGGSDPILSATWTTEVEHLLQHARLAIIPGAAHATDMDSPLPLARVVLPFLRGNYDWDASPAGNPSATLARDASAWDKLH